MQQSRGKTVAVRLRKLRVRLSISTPPNHDTATFGSPEAIHPSGHRRIVEYYGVRQQHRRKLVAMGPRTGQVKMDIVKPRRTFSRKLNAGVKYHFYFPQPHPHILEANFQCLDLPPHFAMGGSRWEILVDQRFRYDNGPRK